MIEQSQNHTRLKAIGWIVSIVGAALYAYGYFAEGSTSLVTWSLYIPDWSLEFIPNFEAEMGLVLSIIGSVPLYYAEFAKR